MRNRQSHDVDHKIFHYIFNSQRYIMTDAIVIFQVLLLFPNDIFSFVFSAGCSSNHVNERLD